MKQRRTEGQRQVAPSKNKRQPIVVPFNAVDVKETADVLARVAFREKYERSFAQRFTLTMALRQPARNVEFLRELLTVRVQGVIYESAFIGSPTPWFATKPTKGFISTRDDMPPMVAIGHSFSGTKAEKDDARWALAAERLADYDLGDVEVVSTKRTNEYGWNNQHLKDAMNIGRMVIVLTPSISWSTSLIRWAVKRNRALTIITDLGDIVTYPDGPTEPIDCTKVHFKNVNQIVYALMAEATRHEQELYLLQQVEPDPMPETVPVDCEVNVELPHWAKSSMSGDVRYLSENAYTWEKHSQVWVKTGLRDTPKVSVKIRKGSAYPEQYQEVCIMQDAWNVSLNNVEELTYEHQHMLDLQEYFGTATCWDILDDQLMVAFEYLGRLESFFGSRFDEVTLWEDTESDPDADPTSL